MVSPLPARAVTGIPRGRMHFWRYRLQGKERNVPQPDPPPPLFRPFPFLGCLLDCILIKLLGCLDDVWLEVSDSISMARN